jgi:hypothetical protein
MKVKRGRSKKAAAAAAAKTTAAAAPSPHKAKKGKEEAPPEPAVATSGSADSQLSDLSDSTEGDDDTRHTAGGGSVAGETAEEYEVFENQLRAKHSRACKAMSVRLRVIISELLVESVNGAEIARVLNGRAFPPSLKTCFLLASLLS